MMTQYAVAGCSIKREASSAYGFFRLPNVIDTEERSENFQETEGNCGWQESIERT